MNFAIGHKPTGHPSMRQRVRAAVACLLGHGVVFNSRMVLQGDELESVGGQKLHLIECSLGFGEGDIPQRFFDEAFRQQTEGRDE